MTVKGLLGTQKLEGVRERTEAYKIGYDEEAVAADPLGASHALVVEAINILAKHFHAEDIPEEAVRQARAYLQEAGNFYPDEAIRRYMLSKEGLDAFFAITTIPALFVSRHEHRCGRVSNRAGGSWCRPAESKRIDGVDGGDVDEGVFEGRDFRNRHKDSRGRGSRTWRRARARSTADA